MSHPIETAASLYNQSRLTSSRRMHITCRQPTPADEERLVSIYADSRRDELAVTGWNEAMIESFARMQFKAREASYLMQFPNLEDGVICADGEVAGRLIVDRSDQAIHIVDIALGQRFRRLGIGTRVIEDLKRDVRDAGKVLTLRVEQSNSAARLFYEKLGFREVRVRGHLIELLWSGYDG